MNTLTTAPLETVVSKGVILRPQNQNSWDKVSFLEEAVLSIRAHLTAVDLFGIFFHSSLYDEQWYLFQVIGKVEKLRSLLTHPSNLRVHVVADVNRLPDNPHVLWKTKLLPNSSLEIPKK